MARPRRPRAPKTERIPIAYQQSDDIAAVAGEVMTTHETHFWALRPLKIAYVMVTGGREPKDDKVDGVWARFLKAPPLWKGLAGFDAIVWIREAVWRKLNTEQREALVAHELSHGSTNDKGELVVVKHDLEEFAWIARHYGPWADSIDLFGKQLSLFGTPDGQAPGESRPAPKGTNGKPPAKDDGKVVDLANAAARARDAKPTDPPVVTP